MQPSASRGPTQETTVFVAALFAYLLVEVAAAEARVCITAKFVGVWTKDAVGNDRRILEIREAAEFAMICN